MVNWSFICSLFTLGKDGLESYYLATYIVIASGAIMTLVGLLGCCSAYQDSQCMLSLVSKTGIHKRRKPKSDHGSFHN